MTRTQPERETNEFLAATGRPPFLPLSSRGVSPRRGRNPAAAALLCNAVRGVVGRKRRTTKPVVRVPQPHHRLLFPGELVSSRCRRSTEGSRASDGVQGSLLRQQARVSSVSAQRVETRRRRSAPERLRTASTQISSTLGDTRRLSRQARQAGGHWFEPSTAHWLVVGRRRGGCAPP
jgi:hypothetical protein